MISDEFSYDVRLALRAGQQSTAFKISSNVVCQVRSRSVPLGSVLAHRLNRDPFELSAHLAVKRIPRHSSTIRNAFAITVQELRELGARPWSLVLANNATQF